MPDVDRIPSLELLGDRLEGAAARSIAADVPAGRRGRRVTPLLGGRWMLAPALAAFVVLALVASVILTDGTTGGGSASAEVVSAMKRSSEVTTGRFHIEVELDTVNGPTRLESEGGYDTTLGRVSQTLDASELLGRVAPRSTRVLPTGLKAQLLLDRGTLYLSLPGVPGLGTTRTGAQRWYRLGGDPVGGAGTPMMPTAGDPSGLLDLFGGVDAADRVGEEEIDGTSTTHYRGEVDLDRAYSGLSEADRKRLDESLGGLGGGVPRTGRVPVEVWVDLNGMVRRLSSEIDLKTTGFNGSVRFRIDFKDLGGPVDIAVPEPSAVTELPGLGELLPVAPSVMPTTTR